MTKAKMRRNACHAIESLRVPGDQSWNKHGKHRYYVVINDMVLSAQAMGSGCEGIVILSYGPGELRVRVDMNRASIGWGDAKLQQGLDGLISLVDQIR